MKRAVLLFFVLLAAALTVIPTALESCGPFLREAVFALKRGPVSDVALYSKGQLGIVAPSFDRKNLVVAFRYLSGAPLTAQEAAAFNTFGEKPATPPPDPVEVWAAARTAAGAAPTGPVDTYRQIKKGDYYGGFENCLAGAFRTAAATLAKRSATWGAGSANLKEWLAGQDQVFSNCSGPRDIPGPATGKDPLLIADRQYQMAAAAFYAGDWDLARKSFDAVAANAASPWREIAPYLKARVSVREGLVDSNKAALERAKRELAALGTAFDANGLSEYVTASEKPLDRLNALAGKLAAPEPGPAFARTLYDYTFLYDKVRGDANEKPIPTALKAELNDWIDAFQLHDTARALAAWKSTGKMTWLVAAAVFAESGDAEVPELLAAIAKVGQTSPAWATLNYRAAAWEMGKGQAAAARDRLDAALKLRLPASARNQFLAARMKLATDWTEFLTYAPREAAGETFFEGEQALDVEAGPLFDTDAATILNLQTPLTLWIDAAQSKLVPASLRKQLLAVAWTRAIVLGNDADARTLAALVQAQRPDLAAAMKNYLAAGADSAHFTAVYELLRNPGLSPMIRAGFARQDKVGELDELRDNYTWNFETGAGAPEAAFFPPKDRGQGQREAKIVTDSASNGANYLVAQAVAYLKAHPADPRGAETLALAVRATHYSTTDAKTGPLSKQAFDLLHKNYPTTKYARDTKYWYK